MNEIPKRPLDPAPNDPEWSMAFRIELAKHEHAVAKALYEALGELDASDPSCLNSEGRMYVAGILERVRASGWKP